jgi:curved DNA-binding protein CbpA
MSNKIEIDFNNLKYNLYEILNVPANAPETKIKKNFMKVIKNFHPDKNSEVEEEIYYHIILANQILLNKDSRKKYDEFINDSAETFHELKSSFNKSVEDIKGYFPEKNMSQTQFNSKIQELNRKHGYDENLSGESVIDRFQKAKNKRDNTEIKIDKEDFRNMEEFNNKFNYHKTDSGKFKDQIIEYKGAPSELTTYTTGENYTNLQDLDKLYVEDTVQSSKYSSLDRAFMLQPSVNYDANKTAEDKMKEYKNQTEYFQKMKLTDFSTKKFGEF